MLQNSTWSSVEHELACFEWAYLGEKLVEVLLFERLWQIVDYQIGTVVSDLLLGIVAIGVVGDSTVAVIAAVVGVASVGLSVRFGFRRVHFFACVLFGLI